MITGNIVADAKKEVSPTTGNERVTFRIGNNDYSSQKDSNGKPITYWFSVTSFNPRVVALTPYLTKGKFVSIIGDYEDNVYQNKNTGNCEIGRNINADSINFVNSGNGEGNNNSNTTKTSTATDFAKATNKGTSGPKPEPKATVEVVMDDDEDDLPF